MKTSNKIITIIACALILVTNIFSLVSSLASFFQARNIESIPYYIAGIIAVLIYLSIITLAIAKLYLPDIISLHKILAVVLAVLLLIDLAAMIPRLLNFINDVLKTLIDPIHLIIDIAMIVIFLLTTALYALICTNVFFNFMKNTPALIVCIFMFAFSLIISIGSSIQFELAWAEQTIPLPPMIFTTYIRPIVSSICLFWVRYTCLRPRPE